MCLPPLLFSAAKNIASPAGADLFGRACVASAYTQGRKVAQDPLPGPAAFLAAQAVSEPQTGKFRFCFGLTQNPFHAYPRRTRPRRGGRAAGLEGEPCATPPLGRRGRHKTCGAHAPAIGAAFAGGPGGGTAIPLASSGEAQKAIQKGGFKIQKAALGRGLTPYSPVRPRRLPGFVRSPLSRRARRFPDAFGPAPIPGASAD